MIVSYRRYRGGYRRNYYSGYDRARQHISEAEKLTRDLGGMDQEVKRYFFGLSPYELEFILDDYGQKYGRSAQRYAERTVDSWRSGAVKMGGMVASRLFDFLPPRMPLKVKYEIVEGLWRHVGPSSYKKFWVGPDAGPSDVADIVRRHVEITIDSYNIPDDIEQKFSWLASGDSDAKQVLLNYFREIDKKLVVEASGARLSVLIDHLNAQSRDISARAVETFTVGKHVVEIEVNRNARGVSDMAPRPPPVSPSIAVWVVLAVILFFVIVAVSHG